MTPFSPLDDLLCDSFSSLPEDFNMSLYSDITPQPEYLTGSSETPSIQFIPPQTAPRSADNNPPYSPVFMPSPSSSYGSLSPSPVSPQSSWTSTSPSSDYGNMSPMVTLSELSRRGSSASLRHHHSPSDPMAFGHSLQPPAAGKHVRSHSESCMARPVASQAMIEANQKRRRHDANHVCEECGQTFTATFSLKRMFCCLTFFYGGLNLNVTGHAQSHTGVRPFTCRIPNCGQSFFNQSDCKRHEKSRKRHQGLPYPLPASP